MARQELDPSLQAEQERLQKLWDAYKAQEDELMAVQKELHSTEDTNADLQAKVAKEEERLQKLWDAYRTQEDELKDIKERVPLMEEKLLERENKIKSLERDVALLEPLANKGQSVAKVQEENQRLKADNEVLTARAKNAGDDSATEKELQKTQKELEKEKDRLEKLYAMYKDQEDEVKHLKATIKEWEAWAKKVRPALEA